MFFSRKSLSRALIRFETSIIFQLEIFKLAPFSFATLKRIDLNMVRSKVNNYIIFLDLYFLFLFFFWLDMCCCFVRILNMYRGYLVLLFVNPYHINGFINE